MATTKTALKKQIDRIYDEIDLHTDLTPKQRAAMRAKVAAAIEAQLVLIHDMIPLLSKPHREANKAKRNGYY